MTSTCIAARPVHPYHSPNSGRIRDFVQSSCFDDVLQFRITMAAIDPSEPPSSAHEASPNGDTPARATLKIIRSRHDSEDESEGESDEEDYLKALLGGDSDSDGESHDSEDSEGESEENGGPSDPDRVKKARAQKEKEALEKMLSQDDDDEHMSADEPNGLVNKGKAKATGDESDSGEEGEELDVETFVICTLDPAKVGYSHNLKSLAVTQLPNNNFTRTTSSHWISQSVKMSKFSSKFPAPTPSTLPAIT
jgi:hypothetical protein